MKNNFITSTNLYLFISLTLIFLNFFFIDYVNDNLTILVLIFFVVFFGLPHGALDTLLAKKNNLYKNLLSFIYFNLIYLSITILTFFLWLMYPIFSLSLFLIISIFHFSEDWKKEVDIFQRLSISTSIISLTILFHQDSVDSVFFSITQSYQVSYITNFFYYLGYISLPTMALILLLNLNKRGICLNIITIIVTAIMLNPLIYFLCYFCFYHSVKNFKESKKILFPNNKILQRKVLFINLLFTIIISIIAFNFFLISNSLEDKLLKITFIGLASLTVPHMLLKAYINHRNR